MKDNTYSHKINEAQKFYTSFLNYTQSAFTGIGVVGIDSIAKEITMLRNEIQYNRQFLLYAKTCIEPASNENYLASHAVRCAVIAMVIGKQLKMPPHRLLDLGIAAYLHDIGMLMLSPQTYLNELDLKTQEKELVNNHPVHSYNMLKAINCSPAVSSAVLEHHERENGSGYPRKLKGDSISLYGKIIAVACSYEALSAKRPYKKMKDQHNGILELLKNEGNLYNIGIVKALTCALSIFPIGTYVLLSNGKQGRVFDINPDNQNYPIVQDDEESIIRTSHNGVSIVNPLTYEEIERKKQGWCSAKEFIMKQRKTAAAS